MYTHMYTCIYIHILVSISLSLYIYIYIYHTHKSLSLSIYVYIYVSASVSFPLPLPPLQFPCLSIRPLSIRLSIHPSPDRQSHALDSGYSGHWPKVGAKNNQLQFGVGEVLVVLPILQRGCGFRSFVQFIHTTNA